MCGEVVRRSAVTVSEGSSWKRREGEEGDIDMESDEVGSLAAAVAAVAVVTWWPLALPRAGF